jgi:hypothetical protein
MTLDPQITGNVGLYYCCYRLSLLGWNVMPTARNARGVDIIAYSRDTTRFHGVQVKARSKRHPVPLGTSLDKIMGDFWVIVNRVASTPSAFILLPSEVKERARRGEKEDQGLDTRNAYTKTLFMLVFHALDRFHGSPNLVCPSTIEWFGIRDSLQEGNRLQDKSQQIIWLMAFGDMLPEWRGPDDGTSQARQRYVPQPSVWARPRSDELRSA